MKKTIAIALACAVSGLIGIPAAAETAEEATQKRMRAMDSDKDGSISMAEFTEFRSKRAAKQGEPLDMAAVERSFQIRDKDGDGAISFAELQASTEAEMRRRGS